MENVCQQVIHLKYQALFFFLIKVTKFENVVYKHFICLNLHFFLPFCSKLMSEIEYLMLSKWFDWLVNNNTIKIDLIGKSCKAILQIRE